MNPSTLADEAQRVAFMYAVPVGGRIIGAIFLWIIGRAVIGGVQRVAERALATRKIDDTLSRYVSSVLGVTLTLLLVIAILSIFGVETASFAGVIAAAGVAIGMAWSGLLSNFAAGVFLILLRPFKVGDMITAAGVTGVVKEIGLFATSIDTADNIRTFVGNTKIFNDTIQNYTTNPYRRVDLRVQLAHGTDPREAAKLLRARIAALPNVKEDPAPSVELLEVTAFGPVLAVRPFCHNDHYWDVYFAANQAIGEELGKAGYGVPEQPVRVRQAA